MRDLQVTCSLCADVKECRSDLNRGIAGQTFQRYCPNAQTRGLEPRRRRGSSDMNEGPFDAVAGYRTLLPLWRASAFDLPIAWAAAFDIMVTERFATRPRSVQSSPMARARPNWLPNNPAPRRRPSRPSRERQRRSKRTFNSPLNRPLVKGPRP